MFSIKGVFKDNTIHLLEPLKIKKRTDIIITFMDEESGSTDDSYTEESDDLLLEDDFSEDISIMDTSDEEEDEPDEEEYSEDYYSKIRKHKRYTAHGNIALIEDDVETVFSLFDYSAGGLSFVSDKIFEVGVSLTASIKDPIDQDMSVLDFEFEVARVVDFNGKYKVGCKFFDEVDEEIWHSLMS